MFLCLCNPVSSNKLNGNNSWTVQLMQDYENAQTIGRMKAICL
jgi:bacterioferritin-associated ferredoxin